MLLLIFEGLGELNGADEILLHHQFAEPGSGHCRTALPKSPIYYPQSTRDSEVSFLGHPLGFITVTRFLPLFWQRLAAVQGAGLLRRPRAAMYTFFFGLYSAPGAASMADRKEPDHKEDAPEFKVVDRRLFTSEGERRPDVEERPEPSSKDVAPQSGANPSAARA